ncbi:MAG: PHP domain-containing protein, partial [Fibrobacteres bacterium]|nr:PHP domain-containing protein [Fibrobacterota bacterium]
MTQFVNNHIHTTYSFSPYSPSEAVIQAKKAGLLSAGIMDHDSIAGAREFIEAGLKNKFPTTIGVECRSDFSNTALSGKLINHPDQHSCAYVAIHGIPHTQIDTVEAFFKPYIELRVKRNKLMVDRLNAKTKEYGIVLDYANDVESISEYKNGGSVTERHILYALALKLIVKLGKGRELRKFVADTMKIALSSKAVEYLDDPANPHYSYDLLGVLKADMVASFYIPAKEECPVPEKMVELA